MERRALEAFAVAQWCKRESKSHYALTPIIAALGDFNLPKIDPASRSASSLPLFVKEKLTPPQANCNSIRKFCSSPKRQARGGGRIAVAGQESAFQHSAFSQNYCVRTERKQTE
jgi:hypothetical protein